MNAELPANDAGVVETDIERTIQEFQFVQIASLLSEDPTVLFKCFQSLDQLGNTSIDKTRTQWIINEDGTVHINSGVEESLFRATSVEWTTDVDDSDYALSAENLYLYISSI